MKKIKLFTVLLLFGVIMGFAISEIGNYKTGEDTSSTVGQPRLSFVLAGNVDESRYTHAEVGDTLRFFVNSLVEAEGIPADWGLEMGSMQTSDGQWVESSDNNFRCWAEVSFSSRGERNEWMETLSLLPMVRLVPGVGAQGVNAGSIDLHLPMMDGSGRWLELSGLTYEYITA